MRYNGDPQGRYGLNFTVVQNELNKYYGGRAISSGFAQTTPFMVEFNATTPSGVHSFTRGPNRIKSGEWPFPFV